MKKSVGIIVVSLLILLAGCSKATAPMATAAATPDMQSMAYVDPDGYLTGGSVWKTKPSDSIEAGWTKEADSDYDAYSMGGKTFCGLDATVTFLFQKNELKSYKYDAKVLGSDKDRVLTNFGTAYDLLKEAYGEPECTRYDKRTYTNPRGTYAGMLKDAGVTGESFYYHFAYPIPGGTITLSLQGENTGAQTGNYGITLENERL